MHSWFIHGLTELLRSFICYYPQYFVLQIRQYLSYGSSQPIKSPSMPFFTLILDFALPLLLTKKQFNTIMLITYTFLKRITLIEAVDTWLPEQCAYAFLGQLDLIDWSLSGMIIPDQDLKFLSKFWAIFLNKLKIKLFYSITYHPQNNGSNKYTDQMMGIMIRFFAHALEDLAFWPTVLPCI